MATSQPHRVLRLLVRTQTNLKTDLISFAPAKEAADCKRRPQRGGMKQREGRHKAKHRLSRVNPSGLRGLRTPPQTDPRH